MDFFWTSPRGAELLSIVGSLANSVGYDPAKTSLALRKREPNEAAEILNGAIEIVLARNKAGALGAWAKEGLFTRASVEQATAPAIAEYHSAPFCQCRHVLEICTGAGIDTAALAKRASRVTSIESDHKLADMARYNLKLQGLNNVEIITGKAEDILPSLDITSFDGFWADPSRRDEAGSRIGSARDWKPSPDLLMTLPISGPCGIKVSPAYNFQLMDNAWVREWIGFGDECREQILWRGAEKTEGALFLADCDIQWGLGDRSDREIKQFIVDPKDWSGTTLVEPHNALVRTGRLAEFFAERQFGFVDPEIAYGLHSGTPPASPLYARFSVLSAFTFSIKEINRRLRELKWGRRSEIKKRGFPQAPEEIRKQLSFAESPDFGTIFVTRVGKQHWALLTKRIL